MSNKFTKLISTGFCLMMILVASQQAEHDNEVQSSRAPASVSPKSYKEKILKPYYNNSIIHTEKIRGPIRTQLEAVGEYAVAVGETFTLRGVITSREQVSDVLVKWSIPKGVELISGSLQNTIGLINPGEPVNFEVTLRKLTESNTQVHLVAGASKGPVQFSDVAQFNTVDQDKIKEKIKTLAESNQKVIDEQRAESPTKELKVFH